MKIKQIYDKDKYMDLLLEADPDREVIEEYLCSGEMYGIFEDNRIVAEVIVTKVNDKICELKNVATVKEARERGYAKKLIKYVSNINKLRYEKMIVGTTENNIPFYVKCGFDRYYKTEKNFFINNYKDKIYDGDLQCIDMYYYYMDLDKI